MTENAELQKRLEENEAVRSQMFHKRTSDENQIRQMADTIREFERMIMELKAENKMLTMAKGNNHKVYEEKIKQLISENKTLASEVIKLQKHCKALENKNKDGYDNREEEEMEPVQAKPHLFGLGAGSRY